MNLARALRPLLGDLLVLDGLRILAVNVAGAGLAYVTHIFLARWLSVGSYGIYVLALSWLNILFIAVQGGLNVSLVRFVAELRASGQLPLLPRLMAFSNAVVLSLGAATAVVGSAIIALTVQNAGDELARALYAMLGLVAVLALLQQRMALLNGLERVFQSALFFEILRPLVFLAAVWSIVQAGLRDAGTVMAVNLAATGLILVAVQVYSRACIAAEPVQVTAAGRAPWRQWLKTSLPYIVVTGMTILLTQMDVLMIGAMLGPEQAGLYAPSAKIALLATFPVVAVRERFAPVATRLFTLQDLAALQQRMTTATVFSVIACAGALAVLVPGRDLLLNLFGAAYSAGAPVLVILAVGYLTYAVAGAAEMFFLVGPFERLNALVVLLTLAVNLVLNLLLIPPFGIAGAAYATVTAVIVRAGLSVAIVHRRTGLWPLAFRRETQAKIPGVEP